MQFNDSSGDSFRTEKYNTFDDARRSFLLFVAAQRSARTVRCKSRRVRWIAESERPARFIRPATVLRPSLSTCDKRTVYATCERGNMGLSQVMRRAGPKGVDLRA